MAERRLAVGVPGVAPGETPRPQPLSALQIHRIDFRHLENTNTIEERTGGRCSGARQLHLEISDSYNSRFFRDAVEGDDRRAADLPSNIAGYSDDQPPTVPEINEAISIGEPHWP
jgi:hypothetical protein